MLDSVSEMKTSFCAVWSIILTFFKDFGWILSKNLPIWPKIFSKTTIYLNARHSIRKTQSQGWRSTTEIVQWLLKQSRLHNQKYKHFIHDNFESYNLELAKNNYFVYACVAWLNLVEFIYHNLRHIIIRITVIYTHLLIFICKSMIKEYIMFHRIR